ncbi:HK97 family phage prohead protease [Peteryoungia desertarenae]|uniref:HK97 family phage prohead protease n=1 Tax=Peteryoungia desertarenae TaxID=1813451 RepID=A0ABX6QNJ3_9HYPH|nr:prohead protease/major capsid protein fusion protein [Peteryoungia desertarenae]QLF70181.1 HK97 family phage prohead protease [Peteryoungia desertarenae]
MTEILKREAGRLSSFDPEARTVDLVLATEAPVRRRSYQGDFDEILVVSKAAINAERLDGMSFLDQHDAYSGLDSRLGSIVPGSLRFEGKTAIVTAKISRNPKGEALFRDLEDGHTLPVSVGYSIDTQEKTEARNGAVATVRATRWTPMEISVVSVPADPAATTRNLENQMTTTTHTRSAADEATIVDLATRAGFPAMAAEALRGNETLADFRARLIDALAEKDEATAINSNVRLDVGNDRQRGAAEAMADALMTRLDPAHKPASASREFVGLSVPELARRCIEMTGTDTRGMSAAQLVTRGLHSTADFPEILANAANKRLQAEFAMVPSALKRTARQSSARDFKAKTTVKLSAAPDLLRVNEHGEFRRGTMVEAKESYRVETFGRIFGVSRQALVNDDLGAFAGAAAKMGAAAGVFEAKTLAALLESNPVMADGKAVFHADHKNLGTGALTMGNLAAGRLLFRKQVGLSGDLVDLAPRFLVVPSELETEAEQLLADIAAAKTEDVPAAARNLELVVEPRLTNPTAWYLAAAPGQVEGLEYSYLEGFEGPYFETRRGFDVDGVEIKVRLDFGAAFLEHRSWVKSPGA